MKKTSILLCFILFFTATAFAQWSNGMDAEYVIGQPDFITNDSGTNAQGFQYPYDVCIDQANGKLYVVDLVNHRVLRFAYPITGNNPSAELAFGQPDLVSTEMNRGGNVGANTLSYPTAVGLRNGVLWVCDQNNDRILKFNDAANISTNGPDADGVLGQTGFTTSAFGLSQSTFTDPYDIAFDNEGNLWVADMNNSRILRFDDANSKANGANADAVLGQTNYTTNLNGTSQSQMMFPLGVTCDGANLFVSDFMNSRILRFDNAASKANGSNADGVLGQADFTSGDENRGSGDVCSANSLHYPSKPHINDDGTLFVSDQNNNRVLIYENATAKANGAEADYVLGKADFVTNTFGEVGQNSTCFPNGLDYDAANGKLLFADEENNRVLQFAYSSNPPVTIENHEMHRLKFSLAQNYPNPFNPTTTIKFNIAVESYVTLIVYDLLGNEVSALVDGIKPAGLYQIYFNGANLATGIYIYKLTAGNLSVAKPMLLLK